MKYYILDLGNGFGTFIKLQSENVLKNNSLISLGESYIVCTIGIEDTGDSDSMKVGDTGNDYSEMLNIKIFSGCKYDPLYDCLNSFRNFQPSKTVIRIGRSNECEVFIDDNMLSRVHCSIEYREHVGWIIRDGHIIKTKESKYETRLSTNGIW
jgi:hypothetical protein